MSMELTEKCKEIRKRLIEVVSKNGGHLGPNLGVVELTVCLNEVFNFKEDIVLFDVGHQAYVYKILTDRDDKFHTIRTRGGLSPFLDPSESTYDHFISGHAGTALAAGVGFATANPDKKVVVIVGDASISNGHSLEALNYVGYKKLDNILKLLHHDSSNHPGAILEKILEEQGYCRCYSVANLMGNFIPLVCIAILLCFGAMLQCNVLK